jgi:phosphatidylglycerol lysyltransferase
MPMTSPAGSMTSFPEHVIRAGEIVARYGWNSTSYQILNPGIELWFSSDNRAVLGYTRRAPLLVAAGGPVCASETVASVCDEFETFARRKGYGVCYVCAEERMRTVLAQSTRHASIALGAQPVWNPCLWPNVIRHRASLRAQLHRAANKGVVVEAVGGAQAAADAELRGVLREWLGARHLPPLHFLVEPNVLDGALADRMILVARQDGKAVAFLVASPIPARQGYLVELVARSIHAPNGSSEMLIDSAMRSFAAEGCRYATLGLVALAHAADPEIRQNPAWLRTLMYFARAHANRFYNFRGLEHFRLKMSPERWDTIYAISNDPRFSVRTLYAVGGAFSGISPWIAITLGLGKAVREELRSVFQRRLPDKH